MSCLRRILSSKDNEQECITRQQVCRSSETRRRRDFTVALTIVSDQMHFHVLTKGERGVILSFRNETCVCVCPYLEASDSVIS